MSKTILVVDDEEDICDLLSFRLGKAGYNVLAANDVTQALSLIEAGGVDLVISDIRMPRKDGIFLLRSMKQSIKHPPPLVFMTGYTNIKAEELLELGACGVFPKPLDFYALIDALTQILQKNPTVSRNKIRANVVVRVGYRFKTVSEFLESVTANISCEGMFIQMESPLPDIGDMVEFVLYSTDERIGIIQGRGTCRWIRQVGTSETPIGVGIEFAAMAESAVVSIRDLVQKTNESVQVSVPS